MRLHYVKKKAGLAMAIAVGGANPLLLGFFPRRFLFQIRQARLKHFIIVMLKDNHHLRFRQIISQLGNGLILANDNHNGNSHDKR